VIRTGSNLAALSDTTGLGLYRITQESLANVAKHAPDATARIRLHVGPAGARLTVRNGLPATSPNPVTSGSGLIGMSARATQLGTELRAGPDGGEWIVDVTVPGATPDPVIPAGSPARPVVS
jgi:signal transduction histidine kinase